MKITFVRFVSYLILCVAFVAAIDERYDLTPGQKFQTCALVAKYDNSLLLSEHLKPFVGVKVVDKEALKGSKRVPQVKDDKKEKEEEKAYEWELEVVVISATDYALTKIEPGPAVKVCDESAMAAQLCHFEPSKVPQYGIDQILKDSFNTYPIVSQKMSNDKVDALVYDVDQTENYCVIMSFNTPDKDRKLAVDVTWQQSYGHLVQWDYHYMYIYILIGFIYLLSSVLYFYYVFFKRRSTSKEYQSVINSKTQMRNSEIQLRILMYMFGNCIVYFLTANHLYSLNKIGYVHANFAEAILYFASLVSNTVFFIWFLYNILLVSSGYLFISSSKGGKYLWFIRGWTLLTLLSFLVFDIENTNIYSFLNEKSYSIIGSLIHVELVVSFACSCFWSVKTYMQLRSNGKTGTSTRFLATMVLIFLPVLFSEVVRDIISQALPQKAFSRIADLSTYSYIFTLVTTLVVAFLWRNTLLDSEKVGKE